MVISVLAGLNAVVIGSFGAVIFCMLKRVITVGDGIKLCHGAT
jgi:hypothetical protein